MSTLSKFKVVILGNAGLGSLELSYKTAFEYLGYEVLLLDVDKHINNYVPFGKLGNYVNTFIGIDSWIIKGNRDLVLKIKNFNPELTLVFCNVNFIPGSLAFLKSICNSKIGLIWPDTVFNIGNNIIANHNLYDFVGCYSSNSIPVFETIGFKNVFWLPLAADQWLHGVNTISPIYRHDIAFIGGWRPERETTLNLIKNNFPKVKLLIKGPEWLKRCKIKSLKANIDDGIAIGSDFAKLINVSKINLNIIDATNFPAANMRFFEISMCNGFQLSSSCPEFESIFTEQNHISYYDSDNSLISKINLYLNLDNVSLSKIILNANQLVNNEHTYVHRAEQLIKSIRL
jgi:spore maturation protein CgeB